MVSNIFKRYTDIVAVAIIFLVISGCTYVPQQSETEITAVKHKEILCSELAKRGFGNYSKMKLEIYTGNNNGCVSSKDKFDANELLVYTVNTKTDHDADIIAAISKDLKHFFVMSQVDGILYDIEDSPIYIHDGEYSKYEAQEKLEKYLIAETTIDMKKYDVFIEAKYIDGADNYCFSLNEKDVEDWTQHAFEFYVSKDLKHMAQLEYVDMVTEQLEYVEAITFNNSETSEAPYTIDEVKQILIKSLSLDIPYQFNDNSIAQQEILNGQVLMYQYSVPIADGMSDVYVVSPDLSFAERYLAVETIEKQPQFIYLNSEK